jgi:hypothetical protein
MVGAGLVAGMATALGSMPHQDARAAAELVVRCLPDLPAAPQLPHRSPLEGVVAQWAGVVPGVAVRPDGTIEIVHALDRSAPARPAFTHAAHAGLLAFLDVLQHAPAAPRHVKVQLAGPLTLGVALAEAGARVDDAFAVATSVAHAWLDALDDLVHGAFPDTSLVVFLDEPALVRWRNGSGPIEREHAIDLLSSVLAATPSITGVHVCGHGDMRIALDAGPNIVHCDIGALDLDDAVRLSRFLEGDGWIAWGAIPTDRPVGEQWQPLWNALAETWRELGARGCDGERLRMQSLIAPACGLAGHGISQAEHALLLAYEIGVRAREYATSTKWGVGA